MKTIKVTDEMYASLMELSKEINTQNHRHTPMPYFFQIQTDEVVYVPDGCGEAVWVDDEGDGIVLEDSDDERDAIEEHWEMESKEEFEERFSKLEEHDIDGVLEEMGYYKVDREIVQRYQNAFFTAKGCKNHIRQNEYHYNKPTDYLNGAFRNPEMELVMKFLCELSGGKLHR